MHSPSRSSAPPYLTLLLQFLGSRLMILLIAAFAMMILERPDTVSRGNNPLNWFLRWDSLWYLDIANDGYRYTPDAQCNVIFLPLFPLLTKAVSFLGISTNTAGYIVSNICLFAASIFLWKLVRLESEQEQTATTATQFLFFGPVSFFFSIVYSEATFFLCLVLALYQARRGRWVLAGFFGYLAALTRSVGVLLVLALVIEFFLQERKTFSFKRSSDWLKFLACGLPGLGTLTYMAYMGWQFGEPLIYKKVEVHWGREFSWFWDTFTDHHAQNLSPFHKTFFFGAAGMALLILLAGLRERIRASYLALGGAYLLLYTSTNLLEALPRYLSVVAPLYLIIALVLTRHRRLEALALAFSAALLTFSTILFVGGYWFT